MDTPGLTLPIKWRRVGERKRPFYNFSGLLGYWQDQEKRYNVQQTKKIKKKPPTAPKPTRRSPAKSPAQDRGGGDINAVRDVSTQVTEPIEKVEVEPVEKVEVEPVEKVKFEPVEKVVGDQVAVEELEESDGATKVVYVKATESDMEVSSGSSGPEDSYDGFVDGGFMFKVLGKGPFTVKGFSGDPDEWMLLCQELVDRHREEVRRQRRQEQQPAQTPVVRPPQQLTRFQKLKRMMLSVARPMRISVIFLMITAAVLIFCVFPCSQLTQVEVQVPSVPSVPSVSSVPSVASVPSVPNAVAEKGEVCEVMCGAVDTMYKYVLKEVDAIQLKFG